MTLSARDVAELLSTHGLEPDARYGQNFVIDPNTVRRIARLAGVGPGDRVIEVGPGLGSLTLALVESGAEVTAVEADERLLGPLAEVLAGTDVTVVHADAMRLDWERFGPGPFVLVANLPYNIAVPLVADVIADVPSVGRMLVMTQLEAARRLTAVPGNKDYAAVTVRVSMRAEAEIVARVGPKVFLPQPRVESALVAINRREPPEVDPNRFDTLVNAAFGQRRKMLRRSLQGLVDAATMEAVGIDPTSRPEQIDLDRWVALARTEPA